MSRCHDSIHAITQRWNDSNYARVYIVLLFYANARGNISVGERAVRRGLSASKVVEGRSYEATLCVIAFPRGKAFNSACVRACVSARCTRVACFCNKKTRQRPTCAAAARKRKNSVPRVFICKSPRLNLIILPFQRVRI